MKRPSIALATLACATGARARLPRASEKGQARGQRHAARRKCPIRRHSALSAVSARPEFHPHGAQRQGASKGNLAAHRLDGSRHGLFGMQKLVRYFRDRAGSSRAPHNARLHRTDLRSGYLGVRAGILEYSAQRPPLGHQGRRSDPQGAQGRRNLAVFTLAVRSPARSTRRRDSSVDVFARLVQFEELRNFRDAIMSLGFARFSFVVFFAGVMGGVQQRASPAARGAASSRQPERHAGGVQASGRLRLLRLHSPLSRHHGQ